MILRHPAWHTMLEVLLALLGHGPPAAGAAGPVALALRAHQSGAALAPWEREYNYVVQAPPSPEQGYSRVESGAESGQVVCKEAERSARRRISQAQDKSR
jgi:hypothetical protein